MSHLVARILLCILMFPIAVVIYCSIILNLDRLNIWNWTYDYREDFLFLAASFGSWVFVAIYWTMLWRKSVPWTFSRKAIPVGLAFAGMFVETTAGWILAGSSNWEVKIILLDILTPALWLIATIVCWRETPAERALRVGASGRQNISCPTCGYNLTGLAEARCPECGSKFTLDELLTAQPGQTVGEIE